MWFHKLTRLVLNVDIKNKAKYISYMTLTIYPFMILAFKLSGYPLNKWTGFILVLIGAVLLCQSKVSDILTTSIVAITFFGYSQVIKVLFQRDTADYIIFDVYTRMAVKIINIIDLSNLTDINKLFIQGSTYESMIAILIIGITVMTGIVIRLLKRYNMQWMWTLSAFIFLVFGWFSYIDVREILIFLLIGSMIMWSEKARSTYLLMLIGVTLTCSVIISWTIPYDFVNDKLGNIAPSILILRSDYEKNRNSYFDFEKSMYYPSGDRLGGTVERDSNKLLMEVRTSSKLVYLRGRVKRTYTGNAWIELQSKYDKFSGVNRYNEKIREEKEAKSVYISYEDLRTLTVFSPLGVLENSLSLNKLRVNDDQMFFYKESLFEDDVEGYKIIYTNYEDQLIDEESYLQIPDTVTERTMELASSLVNSSDSDYEKTIKIRDYLRTTYPYNLIVSDEESKGDFVDNFLFEEKKGYCTYFSSALAILLRSEGIPTRYVEGYIVDPSSFDGEKYSIHEDKSHAWVEAYIDDKGWITVDATPIYSYEEEDAEKKVNFMKQKFEEEAVDEEEEITTKQSYEVRDEKTKRTSGLIYFFVAVAIIFLLVIIYRRKGIKTTRQNAIKLIYLIEDRISTVLQGQIEENLTPYKKMEIFIELYEDTFVSLGFSRESNSDIIKITERILYSDENITENVMKSLQKFYYIAKKMKI